jgi:hypothetical protein
MATYKLIQDIEAEDKILGPLTLRQFIFGMIAVFLFYLCFIMIAKGVPFLLIVFLPPAVFFGFFALPLGRDQSTEVWALAKIRFYFKPRKRIWNQSGIKELVTITAPKKVERVLTNNLSQGEVQSRLKALANTIDSRGWAVKNVDINAFAAPAMMPASSDRLIDVGSVPQPVPDAVVTASDDILDERNNPIAQQFHNMIQQSSQAHRDQLVGQLNGQQLAPPTPAQDTNYWFMGNGGAPASQATPLNLAPQAANIDPAEEAALSSELKSHHVGGPAPTSNLRTMKPLPAQPPVPAPAPTPPPVTAPADPAILSLADNNDLNVATLAREAKRAKGEDDQQGEVVVPLR